MRALQPVFGEGAAAVVAGKGGHSLHGRADAGDEILSRLVGVRFQSGQDTVIGFGRAGGERQPEGAGGGDFALGMAGAAQPVGGEVGLGVGVVGEKTPEGIGGLCVAAAFEGADAGEGEPSGGAVAAGEGAGEREQIGDGLVEGVGGDGGRGRAGFERGARAEPERLRG